MRRIDVCGMVVAFDASSWRSKEGDGDESSIGTRRGGFVNDRDMVSLLVLVVASVSFDWLIVQVDFLLWLDQ